MSKGKEAARYVIIAVSWAVILFIFALTLPIPTSLGSITYVALDGNAPLLWMSGLIAVALLVGALLRYGAKWEDTRVVSVAWLLSGAVFVAGIIGFLTWLFITGLAIALVGLFLLLACNCIAAFRTKHN